MVVLYGESKKLSMYFEKLLNKCSSEWLKDHVDKELFKSQCSQNIMDTLYIMDFLTILLFLLASEDSKAK